MEYINNIVLVTMNVLPLAFNLILLGILGVVPHCDFFSNRLSSYDNKFFKKKNASHAFSFPVQSFSFGSLELHHTPSVSLLCSPTFMAGCLVTYPALHVPR